MTLELLATLAVGAFFGAAVTVLVWALCGIASETDRQMDIEEWGDK